MFLVIHLEDKILLFLLNTNVFWRAPDGVGAVLGLISGSPAWKPCPKASDHGLPPAVRRKEEEVKTDRPSLSLSPSGLPDVFCELAGGNQVF